MRFLSAFVLISLTLSMDVVAIGDYVFSDKDFFKKHGKDEWERGSDKQKKRILNDFIKRESCAIHARTLGFLNEPTLAVKIRDRSNMIMVNSVYEELVARPLVPESILSSARANIKTEIDVSHILIAHKSSRLQQPPVRTKDEAFLLAQNIKARLNSGTNFIDLAKKYSDDPSAQKNGGSLGWVSWGRTTGSFQEAAFQLGLNSPSDPVLTDFGYHLIVVNAKRASEQAQLSGKELELAVYNSSRGAVAHLLRGAAASFDSLNLSNARVKFNTKALAKIKILISEERDRKKISGQYRVDLVSLFESATDIGVVCVYNKRGLGIKWFSQKLRGTPSSRHPVLDSVENIRDAFKTILLQDIAIDLGIKNNISNVDLYSSQVSTMKNSLLYDTYLKWLVNTAEKPDSLQVWDYYNKNKDDKYKKPIRVVVREIRVLDRSLADSLLLEIQRGLDFEETAILFSKTNPSRGGLMQPFAEGKYNDMGSVAFSIGPGEVSPVIENLDRSFSIIRVEKMLPEQYSDIKKVYTRIESLLAREFQNKRKEEGVGGLFEKLNISINTDFFDGEKIEVN